VLIAAVAEKGGVSVSASLISAMVNGHASLIATLPETSRVQDGRSPSRQDETIPSSTAIPLADDEIFAHATVQIPWLEGKRKSPTPDQVVLSRVI